MKVEKAEIVSCNDLIANITFQKRLTPDHLLLEELIMGKDLTLANSFSLAEKPILWEKGPEKGGLETV